MNCISTSVFDIYKVGPGPSSSHTIGPMRAANDFLKRLPGRLPAEASGRIEAELFGSLALTGRGHGTDRAVAAGLLGEQPENCNIDRLAELLREPGREYRLPPECGDIRFSAASIRFIPDRSEFPFSNTLRFRLLSQDGAELFREVYYSVGGGFIRRAGEEQPPAPDVPYRYRDFHSFRRLMEKYRLTPVELLTANESALTGKTGQEIRRELRGILDRMGDAVRRGLETTGLLPGPIRLERRARTVLEAARRRSRPDEQSLLQLDAFSLAAAEENAAGHLVVTAPTSGSAGLLPGVIEYLRRSRRIGDETLCDGLLVAALVAFVARHNASISGAEVGCQGEIGVASAMAAALLATVNGEDFDRIECAAEIALEHHLGLSCDPVDGYVQIPCIERNAVGAVTAWNAWLLASAGDPAKQKVGFDEALAAMYQTGRSMNPDFKETSRGGLAVCTLCC